MPSLRERLAGLSATRAPVDVLPRHLPLHRPTALRGAQPGYSASEELFAFEARPWLNHLPAADSAVAALLARDLENEIPPVSEWLFLDLETTGLAGGTGTYAFLIGAGQLTPAGFQFRQFFLRDLAEEGALLSALAPLLRQASLVITYNGKLFDLPVLETRFRLARLPLELEGKPHLDLLYPARRLWKLRWGSVRLLDLERNLFEHERPRDVPGELIPQLYFDYLRSGDERPIRAVFQHNADDVLTLAALAARMLHLAAAPETTSNHPLELFALGRLFERAGQLERAGDLYELALGSGLPAEVDWTARYRLSLLCKRQREYRRAVGLWTQLVGRKTSNGGQKNLTGYEELAICYEHRLDDPEAAAEVTRRALAELEDLLAGEPENRWRLRRARQRFTHRLRRLTRK
jgi:uncharacterized protein YprB with RNaseH-like and TPR domain